MITRRQVEQVAAESGFRVDSVEKVLRLCAILRRLDSHATTRGQWVLKGGTAINLLYLEVPRMSVDIDLNYTGAVDRDAMLASRPAFEDALRAVCERAGCTVRRAPDEHAGGKFLLRYASVIGGSQNLEVDVSFVARVPIFDPERLATRFPPGDSVEVPTLSLVELAAGKFTALVRRSAARDAFDAARLLQLIPNLLDDLGFRLCFVCLMAGGRYDPRDMKPEDLSPDARSTRQQLLPMLRLGPGENAVDPEALQNRLSRELSGVAERLLEWTPAERRFLDRLHDEGIVDAQALHPDPVMQDRIRKQPMLRWKVHHIRNFLGTR